MMEDLDFGIIGDINPPEGPPGSRLGIFTIISRFMALDQDQDPRLHSEAAVGKLRR